MADGTLAYIAQPSGQAATVFPVLSLTPVEAVFENSQHDFPQRVVYRLDGDAKLKARTEGMVDGALRSIEFPMSRVSCDARSNGRARH